MSALDGTALSSQTQEESGTTLETDRNRDQNRGQSTTSPTNTQPASSDPAPNPSNGFPGGPLTVSTAVKAPGEAHDYLNEGLPHEYHSPAVPGQRQAAQAAGFDDGAPSETAPSGRRSVQFARPDTGPDASTYLHTRGDSWDDGDAGKSRSGRFMSRLKSMAAPGASLPPPKSPQPSDHGVASASGSPVLSRNGRLPQTLSEEGSDADVEESGDEDDAQRQTPKASRRKRMKRRLRNLDLKSAPNTPRLPASGEADSPRHTRLNKMVRRSTMPDAADQRAGLSEGEGRDQLAGTRRTWARGSSWMGSPRPEADGNESASGRFPAHRRRISEMFGSGGVSDGEGLAAPRRPLFGANRATSFGVQRWKQMKNTFKMLGKKKADNYQLHKSAELIAEARAVTPLVLVLASMLQRDEHGHKRIPVLLEQLNLRIVDSQPSKGDSEQGRSERHWLFTIALEYGSGDSQIKWTVQRSIKDIANLHTRYKLSSLNNDMQSTTLRGRRKQPSFPSSVFPWLRGFRGVDIGDDEKPSDANPAEGPVEDNAEAIAGDITAAEGTASEADAPMTGRRKKTRMFGGRRQSSGLGDVGGSNLNPQNAAAQEALVRKRFVEKQRREVEKYLQEMLHWLMFRPDSNRFCRFLELSVLTVRLAAEGNFHGKECFLHIQSSKGIDFRRVLTPSKVIARHSRKWFMVRQNYIVVAESPETMNIYDVYLVDPTFRIVSKKNKLKQIGAKSTGPKDKGKGAGKDNKDKGKEVARDQDDTASPDDEDEDDDSPGKHHTIKIYTSERKIKLFSRNQNLVRQFEQSVLDMLKQTSWHEPHRYDSFAPVRNDVFAQWLVDGRDYMWNVSRAISMAKDVIYIHDWWLSPELYMRRPPAISEKWRLDRLLQRKAREGVKVFVIVYRNVEQAIPIDSEYTKFSLLHLHPNIMVQRSPNQFKKNQFFYAHHEKICIVDHDVAFVGGIDLCFGRWDNPQHTLADDRPTGYEPEGVTPRDADNCQLWPGKDYSNPRVLDFFGLDKPFEEMYDRSKTPRMPWHDIAMQVVGQPARDLTRHFVQRWNYLRRERKPTRPMPFLLPPPDASRADLEELGLTGTCEVQILRTAGDWSLGFPKDVVEISIQSAYVKMIEESEHFVYMENQFFITSTETMGIKVINRIGDALVERILRAAADNEKWKCCILIPLMPGFQNTVAEDGGSSVRLIMQFQYRSICRGPDSIFGRLRAAGVNPEDYIQFFSLRQWGKIGQNQALVTEQLYIHAKLIIVDDRIALIGSANINERSMNGNRDSECAAIVRDTDMVWSTMAGAPYRVGRFSYTLRMRLMREHLGLDVDAITEEERQDSVESDAQYEAEMDDIYRENDEGLEAGAEAGPSARSEDHHATYVGPSFNHDTAPTRDPGFSSESSLSSSDSEQHFNDRVKEKSKKAERNGAKHGQEDGSQRGRGSVASGAREVAKPEQHTPESERDLTKGNGDLPPPPEMQLPHSTPLPDLPATDDTDIGGPPLNCDPSGKPTSGHTHPLAADIELASIHKDCMIDPLNPVFWDDVWNRMASNNTKLYRRIFRCMPDSEVHDWDEYKEYDVYAAKFKEKMTGQKDEQEAKPPGNPANGAAAGIAAPATAKEAVDLSEKMRSKSDANSKPAASGGDGSKDEKKGQGSGSDTEKTNGDAQGDGGSPVQPAADTAFPAYDGQAENLLEPVDSQNNKARDRRTTFSSTDKPGSQQGDGTRRRRRGTTRSQRGPVFPYDVLDRDEAEELCGLIQGHVVQFPYDWLQNEEKGSSWLYSTDQMAPKEIYN